MLRAATVEQLVPSPPEQVSRAAAADSSSARADGGASPTGFPDSGGQPYEPGTSTGYNSGSALGEQSPATALTPSAFEPLAYSASRSDTALRIEDLMRGAAALRTQGNFSKAMALYNEALTIAPRYAEGYRQRALTLVRLGDRVQAQVDYNRFLALDPQAPDQAREEVTLFEQSGRARLGESEAASYSYGSLPATAAKRIRRRRCRLTQRRSNLPTRVFPGRKTLSSSGDYDKALLWADELQPRHAAGAHPRADGADPFCTRRFPRRGGRSPRGGRHGAGDGLANALTATTVMRRRSSAGNFMPWKSSSGRILRRPMGISCSATSI